MNRKNLLLACMLTGLTLPAAPAPASPLYEGGGTPSLYAYVLANNNGESGLFSMEPPAGMTRLWTPGMAGTGYNLHNGWMDNGNLCGLANYVSNGQRAGLRYYELDFGTGDVLTQKDLDIDNLMQFFKVCTFQPEQNRIFGYGVDEKNWACIKYMDADDFSSVTVVKNINYTQYCCAMCHNPFDNNIYAVVIETKKLVRINQETGDYEELIDIPVPSLLPDCSMGLTYLPTADEYLFAATLDDYTSLLYRIDLASGIVTDAVQLPADEAISFFINTDPGDMDAPLRPQYVSMDFPGGSLSGRLNFTLPTELCGGGEIAGNLSWTLSVDSVEAATGAGVPGGEVSAETALSHGWHLIEMSAASGTHRGPSVKARVFVGHDTPLAPANVTLSEGLVKWDAVTEGVNGGYLNLGELFYEVYIDDEYVGETEGTELTFTVSADKAYGPHTAEVKAICGDMESASGKSASVLYGTPLQLDATYAPTEEESRLFILSGDGGDNVNWSYDSYEAAFKTSTPYTEHSECWLITPPFMFDDPDTVYSFGFENKYIDWWGDMPVLGAYLMKSAVPGDVAAVLTEGLLPTTEYRNESREFTVPETGAYRLAVKCSAGYDANPALVRNLAILKTDKSAAAPTACRDLKAEAAAEGALSAKVSFTMPSTDLAGRELSPDASVTATAVCGENTATVTGAPDSQQTVEVLTAQGDNMITVVCSIADMKGGETSVEVFTGIDIPGSPRNLKAAMADDNITVTLTWDVPEEGAQGHFFSPEGLSYRIYYTQGWFVNQEAGTTEGDEREITCTLPETATLSAYDFHVVPSNIAGTGTEAAVNVTAGKPYEIPMNENFADGRITYAPVNLEYPSEEYEYATLNVTSPILINEIFERHEHPCLAVTTVRDNTRSCVTLPKFATTGGSADHVLASFDIWTGELMASEITILGTTAGMDEPVEVGRVEPGEGWTEVEFYLPEELIGKGWVSLMLDSGYETSPTYTLVYGYNINFSTGIGSAADTGAGIRAKGKYVYFTNLSGESYAIYTADGHLAKSGVLSADEQAITLRSGVYVACAAGKSAKVIIR